MPMLQLDGVTARYGRTPALQDVTLAVDAGELVCLIGANGAGKTTTLKTISGLLHPAAGRILLDGAEIHGLSPREILRRGIAHCPEGRRVFPYMTVKENLEMGAYVRTDAGAGPPTSIASSATSPSWPSGAGRPRGRSRGASSRCWPSAARSWRAPD
jgi:branched-chain amino acid transport system ATP-binding protein